MNEKEVLAIIKNEGRYALKVIPAEKITYDICTMAVKRDGRAIAFVPKRFINGELCVAAICDNSSALGMIPEPLITTEFCLDVIGKCGAEVVKHLPKNLKMLHSVSHLFRLFQKYSGIYQ